MGILIIGPRQAGLPGLAVCGGRDAVAAAPLISQTSRRFVPHGALSYLCAFAVAASAVANISFILGGV